jgi:hypothetical protein
MASGRLEPRQHAMGRPAAHNDVVHKCLWALTRSANRSTVGTGLHRVLPAVPRELLKTGRQRSNNSSVPCVTCRCESCGFTCVRQVERRLLEVPSRLTVGISEPGDESAMADRDAPSHMHLWS